LIADTGLTAGQSVESETLSAVLRLDSAVRTALILEQASKLQVPFDYAFEQALDGWKDPPIRISETTSEALPQKTSSSEPLAHTSPGMMLQFAIAGLLTSGQILVGERKSRALQRLFTTATPRSFILLGHYLAIFGLIFGQFLVLITFGQFVLKVDYLNAPLATLLVAFTSALCISALGLLIGTLAKTEEQAIMFSLVPMFMLAGLGGAWVPLEVTGETFSLVGHLTPLAWAMDGFKNISIRGLGIGSVLLPAAILSGYALLFFSLATWRFSKSEEH
jgi:ABC-2 type transport system permease protein